MSNIKKEVEKIVQVAIDSKGISPEDKEVAFVCFGALMIGAHKRKVKALFNCEKFDTYWNNLEKSGYFNKDGTVNFDGSTDNDVPYYLMIAVAQGLLTAHFQPN